MVLPTTSTTESASSAPLSQITRRTTSSSAFSRLDSVSSGPVTRKFRCWALAFITSRRKAPSTLVGSDERMPGCPAATA